MVRHAAYVGNRGPGALLFDLTSEDHGVDWCGAGVAFADLLLVVAAGSEGFVAVHMAWRAASVRNRGPGALCGRHHLPWLLLDPWPVLGLFSRAGPAVWRRLGKSYLLLSL
ncbi:hypothetical protein V6N12_075829 [Hibiscus sabdariffa]|uniref:Uncharacterized protein n=1 Tax=Hibiscus sabdariffa TaxID=183260 RepID=A0ABR2BEC1_9ROSI